MGKLTDAVAQNDLQEIQRLLAEEYRKKILIGQHHLINEETNKDGEHPLHIAAGYEFTKIIELLLKADANVNQAMNDGRTPLFIAAQKGKVKAIEALLKAGAKINHPDKNGWTPLYVSAQEGKVESVQTLLKAGAKIDPSTKDRKTPLFIAIENGYLEVIQALLKGGAKVNQPMQIGMAIATEGVTPLYLATEKGYIDAIQALLKSGASIDQSVKGGTTPLHIAAWTGKVEVVQVLLKAGANIDQPVKGGTSPLHIVAQSSKESIQQTLFGDELDQSMPIGATPLYIAAQKGRIGVVQVLLEADADVDQPTKAGKTPLYIAAQKGHAEIIQALLKAGAKIDQPNKKGEFTSLYVAIYEGKVEAVRVLLQWNANIHIKTKKNERTPLDIAKEKGHVEIIKLLKEQIKQQNKSKTSSVTLGDSQDLIPESKYELTFNNQIPSSLEAKPIFGKVEVSFSFTLKYSELMIGKELGRGGFGVVYQGTYRHNEIAIKQLHLTQPSKEALQEFQQEMEIMNRLRCPQIVSLYGVYTEPSYGIVMEYMPMGSLYQVLHSDKPLDWSVRYSIAVDMAKGVAFLHKENILHRDLKSLNVLLDEHMKAKLTDFGLAKVKHETVSLSSNNNSPVVGSLLWMAPELLKRGAQCTQKSDMYSFGMTVWELASRKRPFEDATNSEVVVQWIKDGELDKIPNDCPLAVSKLITLCWDRETSKRPTADETVKQLLNAKNDFEGVASKGTRPLLV